jgi:hypothetical protein
LQPSDGPPNFRGWLMEKENVRWVTVAKEKRMQLEWY